VAPDLLFLRVPEGKVVKNRLHLDLRPDDQAAEVARLEAFGARRVSVGQGEVSWAVMADPEGNEFDVLEPLRPETGNRSVDVQAAEGERGTGQGAQADADQDRAVGGGDPLAELVVPDRPVEQGRVPGRPDP
jgi:hypothetical protein